jgi:uncharacterized membrane protein
MKGGGNVMAEKTRVLLVGETWTVLKLHIKGFDLFPLGGFENFGVWFMEAMGKFDDIQAAHMPNHIALTSFPSTLEEINRHDVHSTHGSGSSRSG